ncbi:MAG: hypothetical protein ACFFAE_12375 [Candidatus Hodarchaeota archaeon]
MAIRKDQALTVGEFYPPYDKNAIYHCNLNNTTGFLKDLIIFSVLIGFFAFFIIQFLALLIVLLSWIIIVPWLVPKHYKFIQLNKHVVIFGIGSILALIKSTFKTIYKTEKLRYNDIHYLRLDRWHSKKLGGKIDSFGRLEIKINETEPRFRFLIHPTDLVRLIKVLETLRFHSKTKILRSRDEIVLIFPSSPSYSDPGTEL